MALDTSPEAAAIARGAWDRLSDSERFGVIFDLCETVLEVQRAGIRDRHPEYSRVEVEWALRRWRVGDEIFVGAWPGAPLLEW